MSSTILTTTHGTNREAFQPKDWGLFLGVSTIWGASFLFMAIGLDAFHPGLVTWLRLGLGALFLNAIPRSRSPIDKSDKPRVITLAIIWIAIPFSLFPIAQQWIDSGVAGMLNGAVPILTAIVGSIMLKELPGRFQTIGLIIGIAGVAAIGIPSAGKSPSAALGVSLVIIATICYGFATNIVATVQQKYGAIVLMARILALGFIMVTPFGIYGLTQSRFAWPSLLALVAVGLAGTGVAFLLMGGLIGSVGPLRASFITYVVPVIALVLGVVFRDEEVRVAAIIGIVLVIVGAVLASRTEVSTIKSGDDERKRAS